MAPSEIYDLRVRHVQSIKNEIKPDRNEMQYGFLLLLLLQAFMRRLETIKPTRELARDNLLREHFKQEQFAKNVSRSKRRPASAGTVGHSRKSRSISDLSSVDGESVASSRASFQRMQRTGSAKRPVSGKTKHIDNRPVWDAGW